MRCRKKLAAQGFLTYCTTRSLPYHLYADGSELFVLVALVTSFSLSKNKFFDRLKATGTVACGFVYRFAKSDSSWVMLSI